jgi:hypothetical protein
MKKILLIIFIVILILSVNVLAVDIDIGMPAIDRSGSVTGGYTEVDKNNPANESGTINKVRIYALSGYDMTDVEVGIFYIVSGNNLTTRDSAFIGTVVGGSVQTFDVDLTVVAGDYIGLFWTGGRIEKDESGAVGDWRKGGDNIPCTNTLFSFYADRCVSLYGFFLAPPPPPTNVQASDGDYWNTVNITWTKSPGATNYQVYRDGVGLGWLGDLSVANDYEADDPTITPGTASASDGTSTEHVVLSLSGQSANNGTTHTYKVRARNVAGESGDSGTNTGYKGVGGLTYQWQRSAADSNADYSNIDGATTASYNDTEAPADGSGRYYRCVINAFGAAQQISSSDRGYRIVPYWTGPWNTKTISKWNTKEIVKWNGLE